MGLTVNVESTPTRWSRLILYLGVGGVLDLINLSDQDIQLMMF